MNDEPIQPFHADNAAPVPFPKDREAEQLNVDQTPYKPAMKNDTKPIPDPTSDVYAARDCFKRGPMIPLAFVMLGDEIVAKSRERMRAEWDSYWASLGAAS